MGSSTVFLSSDSPARACTRPAIVASAPASGRTGRWGGIQRQVVQLQAQRRPSACSVVSTILLPTFSHHTARLIASRGTRVPANVASGKSHAAAERAAFSARLLRRSSGSVPPSCPPLWDRVCVQRAMRSAPFARTRAPAPASALFWLGFSEFHLRRESDQAQLAAL